MADRDRSCLSAHMNRVTGMIFSLEYEWLLSVGRDKYFQWHDTTSGKRVSGHQAEAWCTSIQYPFHLKCLKYSHVCVLHAVGKGYTCRIVFKSLCGGVGGTKVGSLVTSMNENTYDIP